MKPPVLGKKHLRDYSAAESSSGEFSREIMAKDTAENPLHTGRYLLILRDGVKDVMKTTRLLETKWGFLVANTADFITETMCESRIKDADALFYNELGIALLAADDDKMKLLHAEHADYIVEPEKVVYVPDDVTVDTAEESYWGIKAVRAHETV